MNTHVSDIKAREKAHRHRFEQKYERSIPSCTVKVWECPCGVWSIRHFGCFNANHDQDSLATANALLAQQKDREEKLANVGGYSSELWALGGPQRREACKRLDRILKGASDG